MDTSFIQSFDIKFKVTSLRNGHVVFVLLPRIYFQLSWVEKVLTCPQTITSVLSKYGRTGTVETLTRSGRKRSFTNRDKNDLKRLVKSNRRLTLQNITAKLNECKTKTFSQKTVQRLLHLEGYKRRLAKKKMVVREANRKKRVKWCKEWRGRTADNYWKKSNVFRWKSDCARYKQPLHVNVYIWRKDDEKYNPHLICSRSERKIRLMIWGRICYDGVGTLTGVEDNINAAKVHWHPRQEFMASSCLVFWRKRIFVHGWQCACSQSPHCRKL